MDRLALLQDWLAPHLPGMAVSWSSAIGDASSRRYFRLMLGDGSTRLLMDAPPPLDCRIFARIAQFAGQACHTPQIVASDLERGFLLLEDLGNVDYQTALQACDAAGANALYLEAADALLRLQTLDAREVLPDYDAATLSADLQRFPEWYVQQHLGYTFTSTQQAVWERTSALLVSQLASMPKVFVHFDYHCRNLLLSAPNPGVIDFQDARLGPISYDLVSLLKDVYSVWDEAVRLDVCIRYWQKALAAKLPVPASFDDFYKEFELVGVFRHLRTLGTFARLAHRDGKTAYIADMPAALAYLRETCVRYAELHPLYKLLNQVSGIVPQAGYTF